MRYEELELCVGFSSYSSSSLFKGTWSLPFRTKTASCTPHENRLNERQKTVIILGGQLAISRFIENVFINKMAHMVAIKEDFWEVVNNSKPSFLNCPFPWLCCSTCLVLCGQ